MPKPKKPTLDEERKAHCDLIIQHMAGSIVP